MPYLYKNYCYETIDNVADVIRSDPLAKNNNIIKDVVTTSTEIQIEFNKNPKFFDFTPPSCTKLGFNSSYTGLTIADANTLGWSIALALLVTWGVKVLRRTL